MQRRQAFVWVSILICSIFLKIYQFNYFPTAFHPDEKIYLANAYSLAKTGSDISGKWNPWKIEPFHHMFAELPAVILSGGFLFTDDPFIAGRIPSLFLGITLPVLLYFLSIKLFKSKNIALSIFFVANFNPWIWQLSRMSFDSLFSLWFYISGLLCLYSKNRWRQLITIPMFFVGFFQYQGLKLIYPLIIIPALFQNFIYKKKIKPFHIFLSASLLLVFVYYILFKLPTQKASSRISENSIFGEKYQSEISQAVDTQRRMSLDSLFKELWSNKFTSFYFDQTRKFINAIDLNRIFIANEPAISGFSVWSHGLFYFVDLALIPIGAYYLFRKKRSMFWLLLYWLAIGLMPILITNSNDWYIFRMSWSYLSMILFAGIGLSVLVKQKSFIKFTIIFIYLFSIGNFGYQFYYRYPVYSANGLRLYQRVLASYLSRTPANMKILILLEDVVGMRDSLIVYQQPNKNELKNLIVPDEYHAVVKYKNIDIKNECFDKDKHLSENDVVIIGSEIFECENADKNELNKKSDSVRSYYSINSILDSGNQIKIFNGIVCDNMKLNSYPNITKINQFAMEKMSNEEFCQNWIQSI